jgi:hypothetical protein
MWDEHRRQGASVRGRTAGAATGELVCDYDVMRVGTGQIDYPVLWAARDAVASFAAETQTYRSLLVQA